MLHSQVAAQEYGPIPSITTAEKNDWHLFPEKNLRWIDDTVIRPPTPSYKIKKRGFGFFSMVWVDLASINLSEFWPEKVPVYPAVVIYVYAVVPIFCVF